MKKFIVIILNVFALYLMSTNDKDSIIVGMIIFLTSYLYLFLYFILSNNSRNYTLAQPILISEASLPQAQFKVKKITSYKVDEELLTKEKWEEIKLELNSFAIEFLNKNFPGVEWNSKIIQQVLFLI